VDLAQSNSRTEIAAWQTNATAVESMNSSAAANRRVWNTMALAGHPLTRPATDADLAQPLAALDVAGWLPPELSGVRVLCLAAGGGRQSALFAAAGAIVTVFDLSPAMLALDREVARERGLNLHTIEGSMTDLSALADASFDLVYQPVSTCYVASVVAVYRQVARVLVPGGLYLSQHKQPVSLQASVEVNAAGRYELVDPYYRDGPLRSVAGTLLREEGAYEFLHRLEELIGGLCRSGFVIEDLIEPVHARPDAPPGSFGHRGRFIAPYLRIKARRSGAHRPATLWLP
jgi:SAM-dependent methyltransferase